MKPIEQLVEELEATAKAVRGSSAPYISGEDILTILASWRRMREALEYIATSGIEISTAWGGIATKARAALSAPTGQKEEK